MRRIRLTKLVFLAVFAAFSIGSASAADWWRPSSPLEWQIQLSGDVDTSVKADVFTVDLFETPADVIATLQSQGSRVLCYFRAGIWEEWRPDAGGFPSATKGKVVNLFGGLWWQDIRSQRVQNVMRARLDTAESKGCDGVDVDNVDSYRHDTGFPISFEDQLAFNLMLAREAHDRGLAIGLRNNLEQVSMLVDEFDFAVVENCWSISACLELEPFLDQAKPVLALNTGDAAVASEVCPEALLSGFDAIVKPADLGPERISCRALV